MKSRENTGGVYRLHRLSPTTTITITATSVLSSLLSALSNFMLMCTISDDA